MAVRGPSEHARAAYAALFLVALPIALIEWARATDHLFPRLPPASRWIGGGLAAAGIVLVLWGIGELWRRGGGLPMNLAPPPRFVGDGLYTWLTHPIYYGFVLACAGLSLFTLSPAGFWLVTPCVALGASALVLGYERIDMKRRFGRLSPVLPPDEDRRPIWRERVRLWLLVLIPWVVLYEGMAAAGVPNDAVALWLPGEKTWPVLEWSEIIYVSTYLVVGATPLLARTRRQIRRLMIRGFVSMALAYTLFFVLPVYAPQRPFTPETALGHLLAWERRWDTPALAFPSYHVLWGLIVGEALGGIWWAWGLAVAFSCGATGMHTVADIVAGGLAFLLVQRADGLWRGLCAWAERVANRWHEWRVGPVRVLHHAIFAGLAAGGCVAMAGCLTGDGGARLWLTAGCGLAGAALWAQGIEGSPRLQRPFGFYGGLIGVTVGGVAAGLGEGRVWLWLAAYCAAAPWMQGMGRLRCLVQGCCHGSPHPAGIRYHHPASRVVRLTGWSGVPLHPTPLYSMAWNVFVAMAMARLWALAAPLHLITGMYLILSGLGRFVEEGYRGEPQTKVIAGLRLYQWIAASSAVAGAVITAVGTSLAAPSPAWSWQAVASGAVFGVVAAFALGADFPDSDRRFARLT